MNDIILSMQNGEPVVSSRQIADSFEKRHDHVMRDIEDIMRGLPKNGDTPMFYKTEYVHEQNGQSYPMYLMNRDGFTLLAMGFTGKAALEWKLKYIAAFNEMEKKLAEKPQLTRSQLLATALIAAHEELEEKDKQIAELTPKGVFADAVSASKKSILVGEMAKCCLRTALTSVRTACLTGYAGMAISSKTRNVAITTCRRSGVWRWGCLKSKKPRFSTATTFLSTALQRFPVVAKSTS